MIRSSSILGPKILLWISYIGITISFVDVLFEVVSLIKALVFSSSKSKNVHVLSIFSLIILSVDNSTYNEYNQTSKAINEYDHTSKTTHNINQHPSRQIRNYTAWYPLSTQLDQTHTHTGACLQHTHTFDTSSSTYLT